MILVNSVKNKNMNGQRLFREYAKDLKNKSAVEFVKIEDEWYDADTLITKDGDGNVETCTINYKEMVHWIIKKMQINAKKRNK